MEKYITVGIDPGKKGAISMIHEGKVARVDPIPILDEKTIDLRGLNVYLRSFKDITLPSVHVFLEQVSAMPGQGVVSMFSFGRTYGQIEGMLVGNGLPYTLVRPQKWQKVMYEGVEGTSKERSIVAAQRLFPDINFLATERSRKPHEGMCEAALIGLYGWRMLNGKESSEFP